MLPKSLLIAAFSFLGTLALASDDEKKPPVAGKLDKAKMFEKMDANGDGKVTKEEFKKFREQLAERMKNLPNGKGGNAAGMLEGVLDKLFEKMDANNDGVVTKEEFEKFQADNAGKLDAEKFQKLKDRIKAKKDGE